MSFTQNILCHRLKENSFIENLSFVPVFEVGNFFVDLNLNQLPSC